MQIPEPHTVGMAGPEAARHPRAVLFRLLKHPFFGRFGGRWRWPEGVPEAGWERVSFASGSGAVLRGAYAAAAGAEPRGTVVCAHPMGRAAKGFFLKHGHAALLRRAGYHVLVFDFNGFGESGMGSFAYPADVLSAGRFARARAPALPVAVLGASFGASWSLCALAEPGHPFRAAVLEAATTTLPEFWRHYPGAHAVLRLSQVVYPPWERSLRPVRFATRVTGEPSVLLVYAEGDRYTPPEMGTRLAAALEGRARTEVWTVPEAEHTFVLRDARAEYEWRVVGFLDAAMAEAGAGGAAE